MAKRAMIAMSGGVDSSAAALLVQKMGYECVGVTMKLFENEDVGEESGRPCCSLSDAADAARAAAALGMPHYVFDFSDEFRSEVIDRFVAAYIGGATPNPCIDCNDFLKFGELLERAQNMGFDKIATGHYAKIEFDEGKGRFLLRRPKDLEKDQTYFLYTLTQEQLSRTLFPLADLTKAEARELAAGASFPNAQKRESQDICFVRGGDYGAFLQEYMGAQDGEVSALKPGNFVDEEGNVLGRHEGVAHYTVGQRKGLGIALGRPIFVSEIRPKTNEVVLADESAVFRNEILVSDVNWIACEAKDAPKMAEVAIRYRAKPAAAELKVLESGDVRVHFDSPVRAPARGQAAVFYDGDVVIGGGRIGDAIRLPR